MLGRPSHVCYGFRSENSSQLPDNTKKKKKTVMWEIGKVKKRYGKQVRNVGRHKTSNKISE